MSQLYGASSPAVIKPGLWFDLGGSTLDFKNTPGWEGPEKPCLSDPEFARLLERAVDFHTRQHSLGLLKLDFANLYCHRGYGEESSLMVLQKIADPLKGSATRPVRETPQWLSWRSMSLAGWRRLKAPPFTTMPMLFRHGGCYGSTLFTPVTPAPRNYLQ